MIEENQDSKATAVPPPRVAVGIDEKTGLPVKKGVLSVTTTISSLPSDIELNPSILDFIEQVVRPINISAREIETALPTELDEEEEKEDESNELPIVVKKSNSNPISFPVDICLNFQIHPSKIILTCNPHARVRCQIVIPTVSFIVSFSLFSKSHYDFLPVMASPRNDSSLSQSPPNSSITSQSTAASGGQSGGNDDITTINDIIVTGCLQTFQLTLYTPNVQSSLLHNQAATQSEDKEVISLVLGQAYIHLSRSSVFVNDSTPCKSVDDYATVEKLKVSGECQCTPLIN